VLDVVVKEVVAATILLAVAVLVALLAQVFVVYKLAVLVVILPIAKT
jgi:hypothetical protein